MLRSAMSELEDRVKALPKVELHQHVDGSIPAEVTWELMRHYRLNPVPTLDEMRRRLEIQEGEEGTLLAYLDKMHYPLWITQFYENISRVTEAIVDAAAAAGVATLELRYSPVIHTFAGLTPRQSIRAVLSGMNHVQKRHPALKLGLVVIAMRQHGPHIAKILARQALAEAQHLHERTGVVGFDIAGPERGNAPRLFKSAYEIARLGHLGATTHAGEDAPAEYVWQAVDELGAQRIGHGCSAATDPELLRRLARDGIVVECCVTSNYHTGAVPAGARHPLHAFLEAGVKVAICCDNTTVSRTDQTRETLRVAEAIGFDAVEAIHREAARHTFIRPETALPSGAGD
jgi:adenosine deaminase